MRGALGLDLGMNLVGGRVSFLGPELVVNGAFDADTNWLKTAGWITGGISGGVASCVLSGINNFMTNDGVVVSGKTYAYSVEITEINSGFFRVRLGTFSAVSPDITTLGTHTGTIVADGTSIIAYGEPGFDGKIDNFSIREVL